MCIFLGCGGSSPGVDPKAGWILTTLHTDGVVYEIDPATAELTELVRLDLSEAGESFNPPSADVREDGVGVLACNKPEPMLFEFDICAGTADLIGETKAGTTGALSFGADGGLFLLNQDEDTLMTVELNTGRAIKVGKLGFDLGFAGLTYDVNEDRMLGINADGPGVFEVNPKTARTRHLADLSEGDWRAVGVEFDAERGLMLVSDGPSLWEVDPDSGEMSFVGDFGELTYVNDLTLSPPCE